MKFLPFRILLASALLPFATSRAALTVYVSPNDIESAEDSGIVGVTPQQIFTENFNDIPVGPVTNYVSPTVGVTYTAADGGINIQENDQYGGDNEGNYLGIAAGKTVTMTLPQPSQYFGFYFTAGDQHNSIGIYSGGIEILNFSTATLIAMLPNVEGSMVTAINGNQYLTANYYGKPGTFENSGEPYAYLHFVASGTTTFDEIRLSQGVSAIFENDNHSILTGTPDIPESLVYVTGGSPAPAIPEPSGAMLAVAGIASLALVRKRA